MNDIKLLTMAVEEACGCRAVHVRSEDVIEKHAHRLVWDGTIEVFELQEHPTAKICYAWQDYTKGYENFVTILGVPAIDSVNKAVQAYIVSMGRKKETGG
ncbi:MAG: hypothetical protein PHR77_13145 [Kiritimatiellae bacterium]|nr:hypothetical protein [Kiritimatiellia bacterium]MDD5520177.1 hypothetical protein [Kiritimatiellia bacterium]